MDEALFVLNVMDGEERNDQVERSLWQGGVQILVEKLEPCFVGGQAGRRKVAHIRRELDGDIVSLWMIPEEG
jgi:hypothetical protein